MAGFRGRKVRGHIGDDRRRAPAFLERQRIGKRLQSRPRLPQRERAVNRAAMRRVEVVARSFPRQPLARIVLQDDDGHVAAAMLVERGALTANDALHVALQAGVDGSFDAMGPRGP
jgi:hypothetical protein